MVRTPEFRAIARRFKRTSDMIARYAALFVETFNEASKADSDHNILFNDPVCVFQIVESVTSGVLAGAGNVCDD